MRPSKPYLSKLDYDLYRADLRSFAWELIRFFGESRADAASPEESELRKDDEDGGDLLDFLTAMTEQMVSPKRPVDISRLALRVAARYLERGVLFLVKDESVSGLGGFGIPSPVSNEVEGEPLRKVTFELKAALPFAEVARKGHPLRFNSDLEKLLEPLYAAIGRGASPECIVLPLLNHRRVLALLYADNGSSGQPLGDLQGLELFISQAGIALENLHLHQKLALVKATQRSPEAAAHP